ncbi:hypothetical protein DIU31_003825 [Mucilaginibacter rubeus]|uniref:DUF1440 domain-containing protein n=1 Tax=Mucilaginibacter rubeus TaxID=2027860 RepID=A0AAE6JC43_9SPHI|nr:MULTISPECIES: hypothetical protein [Mucilaginibacter]QEM02686.1 hypothetical protein DIU31_003825 [Mucilaginibacter rubeus]QEM15306.1 hypothetical protein DIU38_003870 [Mucilaginibacter gossypii]QTE41966.1 hypothetical protein J3L19_23935 [Mucilaginibacter rubeus]QTE48567.1 hypothetical protein J3L21_23915 [Mucilaginibacter rubeus]QTE59954.1 hypothetical protein J3L23_15550 [Mucilaginibacter rubeus]
MKPNKALAIAGFTAITLNTIMLKLAKIFNIKAESGGLLKLTLKILPSFLTNATFIKTDWFWLLFHFGTGAVMVIIYAAFFNKLALSTFFKGLLFSLFPWVVNGVVVLPTLNQGIFGLKALPLSGVFYFFLANILFGFTLSQFYEMLRRSS